jgi:hypothetical protein
MVSHMTSPWEKKYKNVVSAVSNHGCRKKGVIFVNFLCRKTTVNSDDCNETLKSLNADLCCVCPTRKKSKVLLLHDSAGHTQVYAHSDHRSIWLDTIAAPQLQLCQIFTCSSDFSNVVMKFCEMLTCISCKYHEIQNRCCWFLPNSCRANVDEKNIWTTGGWSNRRIYTLNQVLLEWLNEGHWAV